MKKNIVLIVNDHQAYYGHQDLYDIKRPSYDAFVSKGADFEKVYCSTPICCPSRRSLVSGLYTCHHGQKRNEEASYSHETYIERLCDVGYDVYYYGKWHTGKGVPSDFGAKGVFCEGYGNPYLLPRYKEYLKENNLPFPKAYIEDNWCTIGWIDDIEEGKERLLDRETMNECMSGILTTPKETHEAYFLAHEACTKLEELSKSNKPFCLQVEFWGPHQPYLPTKEYAQLYDINKISEYPSFKDDLSTKPEIYKFEGGRGISENYRIKLENDIKWEKWARTMSRCYGQITLEDEAAGLVIEKLEELGMMDNTLVIWTTDHGDALASHGGHFDKDAYMAEEILRIPLGIRCDGLIPAGIKDKMLVSNIDIAPTILNAAGTSFIDEVDGINILEHYTDSSKQTREYLFAESFGHHIPHRAYVWSNHKYKYVENVNQIDELYDLENDPYEMNNLALDTNNDIILNKMKESLLDFKRKQNIE